MSVMFRRLCWYEPLRMMLTLYSTANGTGAQVTTMLLLLSDLLLNTGAAKTADVNRKEGKDVKH